MPPAPLSIGFIGAGFIAQAAHLPAFAQCPDCRLAAISDNRSELLDAVANRHQIPARFADYRELLNHPGIDAVVIAMPRRAQSIIVADALTAGQPVLTEKPLAFTAAVAAELVECARRMRARLAVGFMRRCDAGVMLYRQMLTDALAGGPMGPLLHVRVTDMCGAYPTAVPDHVRTGEKRPFRYAEHPALPEFLSDDWRAPYDYSINVASHDIDLLHYLFGAKLEPAYFRFDEGGAQFAAFDTAKFGAELVVGPAELGTWEQTVEAFFRRGSLILRLESSLSPASATVIRRSPVGMAEFKASELGSETAFVRQAAAFLSALQTSGPFAADGEDALRTLDVIESLWRIAKR